jgi:hypothetical protein
VLGIFARIVLAIVLYGFAVWSYYGFMTAFDPFPRYNELWRFGYFIFGSGSVIAAIWLLRTVVVRLGLNKDKD